MEQKTEEKVCQSCESKFVIDASDFGFYGRVNVPAPTFCPDCRLQRRLAFRSERFLRKTQCDLCKKNILSMYPKDSPFPVYCRECWWSDKWDGSDYGVDYDFGTPMFEQFRKLQDKVPKQALYNFDNVNSDYANFTVHTKNCYWFFGVWFSEDSAYGNTVLESKRVYDSMFVGKSENAYECMDCNSCYNTFFSRDCLSCMDSWFLFDCRNCQHCLFSANLRNKEYHVFNKPVSKEEYEEIKKKYCSSYEGIEEAKQVFKDFVKNNAITKYMFGEKNTNVTGNYLYNSKNTKNSFIVYDGEDCAYVFRSAKGQRDTYDIMGVSGGELCYESTNFDFAYQSKFCVNGENGTNCDYGVDIYSSENIFSCIGMRKKKYCILNKQYTKEEYEKLVPQIKKHMAEMPYIDAKGREYKYGEFYPIEIMPFAYNETVAQEYFPLSEKEASSSGFQWKSAKDKDYKITLYPKDIPAKITDVEDSILGEVIGCENEGKGENGCTTAFKIIPSELQFYRAWGLPIPHLCPNCRQAARMRERSPLKLWKSQCMKEGCTNEFETCYEEGGGHVVYCKECYEAEVA